MVAHATARIGNVVFDCSFIDGGKKVCIAVRKKAAKELLRVFNRGDIEIDRNSVGNVECRGKWGGIGQAYDVVNATVGYAEIGSGGRSEFEREIQTCRGRERWAGQTPRATSWCKKSGSAN